MASSPDLHQTSGIYKGSANVTSQEVGQPDDCQDNFEADDYEVIELRATGKPARQSDYL